MSDKHSGSKLAKGLLVASTAFMTASLLLAVRSSHGNLAGHQGTFPSARSTEAYFLRLKTAVALGRCLLMSTELHDAGLAAKWLEMLSKNGHAIGTFWNEHEKRRPTTELCHLATCIRRLILLCALCLGTGLIT